MTITAPKPAFAFSEEVLSIPMGLCLGHTFAGLTGAQLRIALVLTALAAEEGSGFMTIDKPRLQSLTGVRLDNAHRTLAPIAAATIDGPREPVGDVMWHDDIADAAWFDRIDYVPGIRHQTAGIIAASLSTPGSVALHRHGLGMIKIEADELSRYSSTYSILLRLYLGALMVETPKSPRLRITADNLFSIFRSYSSVADIKRTTAADGETSYVSLSRAKEKMLSTAAEEINDLCPEFLIELIELRDGPRIAAIDVKVRRLTRT
jgi:hypothetical protein